MTLAPSGFLRATSADLPTAVARALADPGPGSEGHLDAAGYGWAFRSWGDESGPPLVLVHGITSDSRTFWRIGPALAAAGRWVVAVDLPGHGATGGWRGRHRFRETAEDLAGFVVAIREASMASHGGARAPLAVLGHSWGGMVVAGLPAVGLAPETLVLLDPPALPWERMEAMTHDPQEQRFEDVGAAIAATRAAEPAWSDGDVRAKAEGLVSFDPRAVRSILVGNGDWDGGLAELPTAVAAGVDVWLIRGEERCGGMTVDALVPRFAALLGPDRVVTIADAPHSPQRMFPEATVRAVLRAIGR